ncbi:MBOAT-domain-containing protein [Dichomitus squalens]|uniref:O-acyltransferase n=1 Tax=Dichomitus squalens TaxID=114155 RepID=A0A4Q9NTN8_9APHY|nr:MBOAT-domain-containing protein [Dichomitus squalens LYAD-421 SS1]EJF64108.1 MBOAT-domain-containing protein [Dichomitus squalens LYAD-421 SS1]TBU42826.1 MBOAT-domain-containing protein [Dichomitus squalens]TBU53218.1 MBOAT-domain-containing protein [Dichomitus squalens]
MAQGTVYVSQPYRSSSQNKLRAMVTFAPRKSLFDISNESTTSNQFRGFFTLFWLSLFIFAVRTYVRSIELNGWPLNFEFASMFTSDGLTLALSDAVLVLNTGLCVPFAKAIAKGWIRYYPIALVIQHLWQCAVLALAVTWTFNRHWPWVQSGFLTLHSFVMIMKMHSYLSTNGELAHANSQAERVLDQLQKATESEGGWDTALRKAEAAMVHSDVPIPAGTPDIPEDAPAGSTTSYVDARTAVTLRQRLKTAAAENEGANGGPGVKTTGTRVLPLNPAGIATHPPTPSEILSHHPNAQIAALAKTHVELERELTGPVEGKVRWPANVSLRDFAWYQLTPTLVYELEYPRTERIRPLYVFEKTVAFFGTFALLYTIVETFIIPLTPTPDQSFVRSLLDLSMPFMISYLLLFYIIFECICNGFAELSYFADRNFYDDWWNSTSWDEFSRKWNKPVHTFLLRHVYASTMSSYKLSRQSAMFLTFLLSAAAHELVMAVVTKKIRFYLFVLQIAQIPLIAIGRIPAIRRNKLLGNLVFWLGLYAGFPLLCVAYCAY